VAENALRMGMQDSDALWFDLAAGLANRGLAQEVDSVLGRMAVVKPELADKLRFLKIRAFVKAGDMEAARQAQRVAVEARPRDRSPWLQLLFGLRAVGDEDGMRKVLGEMEASLGPESWLGFVQLVEFLSDRGESGKAFEVLRYMRGRGLAGPRFGTVVRYVLERSDGSAPKDFEREHRLFRRTAEMRFPRPAPGP